MEFFGRALLMLAVIFAVYKVWFWLNGQTGTEARRDNGVQNEHH